MSGKAGEWELQQLHRCDLLQRNTARLCCFTAVLDNPHLTMSYTAIILIRHQLFCLWRRVVFIPCSLTVCGNFATGSVVDLLGRWRASGLELAAENSAPPFLARMRGCLSVERFVKLHFTLSTWFAFRQVARKFCRTDEWTLGTMTEGTTTHDSSYAKE